MTLNVVSLFLARPPVLGISFLVPFPVRLVVFLARIMVLFCLCSTDSSTTVLSPFSPSPLPAYIHYALLDPAIIPAIMSFVFLLTFRHPIFSRAPSPSSSSSFDSFRAPLFPSLHESQPQSLFLNLSQPNLIVKSTHVFFDR